MDTQFAANIIAIIAASISAIASLATVAAVWVAVIAIKENRKQTVEAQYGAARPLVIPIGGLFVSQPDHPTWLAWGEFQLQELHLRNIGSGAALNVASVYYPPLAYMINGKASYEAQNELWTCWLGTPIAPGDAIEAIHRKCGSTFYNHRNQIRKHIFNAPPEPLNIPAQKEPMHLARLVVTYHDIFNRKHASIFDMVANIGWGLVAFEENIEEDLHDLQG